MQLHCSRQHLHHHRPNILPVHAMTARENKKIKFVFSRRQFFFFTRLIISSFIGYLFIKAYSLCNKPPFENVCLAPSNTNTFSKLFFKTNLEPFDCYALPYVELISNNAQLILLRQNLVTRQRPMPCK